MSIIINTWVHQQNLLPLNSLSPALSSQNAEDLKTGQKKMTEMLRVFDKICMDNDITYFAIGGTLLGARVYSGWIPWDGDVDVEILKSDWPKLNKLLKTELPPSMWLQTAETDEHYQYHKMFQAKGIMGKIRDKNSCYKNCQDGQKFHNGFMIDLNLFYVDPSSEEIVMPHNKKDNETHMYKNDIFPLKRVPFDTIMINMPQNPDKYLQRRYKPDNPYYMIPVKDRYPHEGLLDPHNTCDHHFELYPKIYKRQ